MKNILDTILAAKRAEVADAKRALPLATLVEQARRRSETEPARDLLAALRRGPGQPVRVIAEVKRASPSAGPIRPGADVAEIARAYAAAGAAAISVLTDREFFDGQLAFLTAARAAVGVPVLRKDFLVDPYQVVEARAAGADGVLLIVAALPDAMLAELLARTRALGMTALVEVHDEAELSRALAQDARLLGVNHRNLRDFSIDMSLTSRLRARVPAGTVLVGESGIRTVADVRALGAAGADAVLIGETLMRAASPGAALAELVGGLP
jgi:indole-3-glycerol phosphate synthase